MQRLWTFFPLSSSSTSFVYTSFTKTIEFDESIPETIIGKIYLYKSKHKGLISYVVILLNFHNENFGEGTNKEANCAVVSWKATYLKVEKSYVYTTVALKQTDIEPKYVLYKRNIEHWIQIYNVTTAGYHSISSCWHIGKFFLRCVLKFNAIMIMKILLK